MVQSFFKNFDFEIFSASMKILENFQNGDKIPNCTENKMMGHNDAARLWFGFLISFYASENCIWKFFKRHISDRSEGVSPKSETKSINEKLGIQRRKHALVGRIKSWTS